MPKTNILSESAFWQLIDDFEHIEKLTPYGRRSIKYYVCEMQNKIDNLEGEIEQLKEDFERYKHQQENDYDPEVEIPRIHGKGISY